MWLQQRSSSVTRDRLHWHVKRNSVFNKHGYWYDMVQLLMNKKWIWTCPTKYSKKGYHDDYDEGIWFRFTFQARVPAKDILTNKWEDFPFWKVQIWCKWVCLNHGIPTSHLLSSFSPQNWQHIWSNPPFLDKPKYHLSVESSTKSHDHKLGTIWLWLS